MSVYLQNYFYTKKFWDQAYQKTVKSCSYTSAKNFWLDSKYILISKIENLRPNFLIDSKFSIQ